ncbi:MAG: Do family serine endopeptidase [Spirochaetaceae bacterium]|jgi:Do/DeqQ family serine protease|nr:Do family serine endopeptidase [Spirochaetaceae bacterium]
MDLAKNLSSKKFFIFNLVLFGAIFGFALAFLTFSCTGSSSASGGSPTKLTAQAQNADIVVPADSLAVAESVQGAFRAVADKVVPSVVQLKTVSVRRQQIPNFNGIPWEFFFGPNSPRGGDGGNGERGQEYRAQGLGSGIIVRQDGNTYFVLTNNHVVTDEQGKAVDEIAIETNTGKEFPAKLVGRDERRDLAMVSFSSSEKFPLAVLGDSDAARVGDWAIAVGNPLGFSSSVTMGIISAVGRTGGPGNNINDFIQTDASINQGNSGGALVNIRGEVIGVNMWIASSSGGGSVGLGFSIPINNAKRTIGDFISKGEINDGWLGVSLMDISRDNQVMKDLQLDGLHGALASDVFIDSPADKAGIMPGDFITKVDGKEMQNLNRLMQTVGDLKPGETHTFTAVRDGATQDFKVKIEVRSNEVASQNKKLWPGVYVHSIDDELRTQMKLDKNISGLMVVRVIEQSPAAVINLQRGDIISAINDTPVKDVASFYKALREKAQKEFWADVERGDSKLQTMRYKR